MNGGNAYLGATGTGNLVFATGTIDWSERMRIDSSGRVGIGTSSPSAKLDVGGVIQFLDDNTPEIKIIDPDDSNYALIGYSDGTMDLSSNHGNEAGGANVLRMLTGGTERMRIDSSGNVGIGTSSPNSPLEVSNGTENHRVAFGTGEVYLMARNASSYITQEYIANQHVFTGYGDNSSNEAMRIDSSGNLLVGTTNADVGFSSTSGSALQSAGQTHHSSSGTAIVLNRTTSDGVIANFRRNGSSVGYIGSHGGTNLTIYRQAGLQFTTGYEVIPNRNGNPSDNIIDLGSSSYRFDDIRATNGTIQTSDFNDKQDIATLTATEMLVGKRISALFKTFRWKDKVVEKGDNARTHTGIVAQDVQAAFTAEGLDAGDYALFISDTWWTHDVDVPAVEAVAEVTDEDGNVTTEAVEAVDAYTRTDTYDTEDEAPEGATSKTRLGIRYPELLSFVAAYNEQRFASIEARLTALEG
jgi:hypothetical protein